MSDYDQTKGELCDKCGWAMKFPDEPCRCELESENAALKQRILDDNKAYGCEIRDPSGTIWDYAQKLQKENASLREDKARMDHLACGFDFPKLHDGKWHCFAGEFFTLREAIDAERKEAQP